MSNARIRGVVAAVATPVQEDGSPDTARATKLARFLLDNGCDGLNVLGTYRVNAGTAVLVGYDDRYRQGPQINARLFPVEEYQRTNRAVFAKVQYLYRY